MRQAARTYRPPSRPGEFHPEPLTDPDLTLSRHPARATARRLPPSVENWSSSCCQLARSQRRWAVKPVLSLIVKRPPRGQGRPHALQPNYIQTDPLPKRGGVLLSNTPVAV